MTKNTKRNFYEAMVNYANDGIFHYTNADSIDVMISDADLTAFAAHEIEILDKKNEKAREYAEKKKNEEDPMLAQVQAVLTNELQTLADIVAAVADETITTNKASARLTKLVNAGVAVKEEVKVEVPDADGKVKRVARMAYKLA